MKKKLPGRFFELNIHFGVFLGGQGDFSELFLGHMENFRGCMEDVCITLINKYITYEMKHIVLLDGLPTSELGDKQYVHLKRTHFV